MARSSSVSEASFIRLIESSRLAAGWNLALVFASVAAVLSSGQPWPLRLYLVVFILCLIERMPPAVCGMLSIDRHGYVIWGGDRRRAAGRVQAATITALWIELRLAGVAGRPVIWRDQTPATDWAKLRRWLLAMPIGGIPAERARALRVSASDPCRARRRKSPR